MDNQEMLPVTPEINEEPTVQAGNIENQQVDVPVEMEQEPIEIPAEENLAEVETKSQTEVGVKAEPEVIENTELVPVLSLDTVMAMFDELNRKFDEKIARDTHKNALFDKMYAELCTYKNDIYQKMLKPIVMNIIELIDDTNKFIRDVSPDDTKNIYKSLCMIPDDLLEILERNGIEAFHNESDEYNPETQRQLKTVPTEKPEMDNKVESRICQGYKWDGTVIKHEMIQCYKYTQNIHN